MSKWMGSWYMSQTKFDTRFFAHQFSRFSFENQTLRMIVYPHAAGNKLRFKFSNRYGVYPLTASHVTVARHIKDGKIDVQTDADVSFDGKPTVTIPVGEEIYSDPVLFQVDVQTELAVSIYLPMYTKISTWHYTPSRSTYVVEGNQTKNTNMNSCEQINSYYWLNGMDVLTEDENARVIVAFGDSITEGYTSTMDANHRWPDYFQHRIYQKYTDFNGSVLNAGLTGNQILSDEADVHLNFGASIGLANAGEKALRRIEWDVFSQYGVSDIIFFSGINDIFGEANRDQIITGMKEVAAKAHQRNLKIFIGTLLPFGGSEYYSEEKERARQGVNQWIRSNQVYDGVIDFDHALRDPQNINRLLPDYDSGDHVHPNNTGFEEISESIPLSLFFD